LRVCGICNELVIWVARGICNEFVIWAALDQAREILAQTARHDAHTGEALWTPAYGAGKVNAREALSKL
jgi:hypothetical protein